MGDRTFSAEDVLRIYEDYLTETEMQTVEDFFAPEEPVDNSLLPLVAVRNLLNVLDPLSTILSSFPIAIIASAFAPARIALALVVPIIAGVVRILKVILAVEEASGA